jgi:cell division protein FtsA
MGRTTTSYAGFLDIGSSKVCCMIAAMRPASSSAGPPDVEIIGIGHQRSQGVRAGVIVDLDQAEQAVRAAVAQAERMAGRPVEAVYVAVACGRLRSRHFSAHAEIESRIVSDSDIARALLGGRAFAEKDGRALIHLTRLGCRLDGHPGIRDPRGMAGRRLTLDLHAVTADEAPVRNLLLLIERCLLSTAGFVAAPHASAMAVTTEEERQLGVVAIDIGGGATTLATFTEGRFVATDAIAVGGYHITSDIARMLLTPLSEAERIKTLYGTLAGARSDEHETVTYPLAGEDEGELHQTTRAELHRIASQRMESLLGLVRERVEQSAMSAAAGRIVLTGGASQMPGCAEFAAGVLGRPCRIGRPAALGRLPQHVLSPAFATVVGLVEAARAGESSMSQTGLRGEAGGYLGRMKSWLTGTF